MLEMLKTIGIGSVRMNTQTSYNGSTDTKNQTLKEEQ
jgi:hypothetical protein